jgi:hypothetical protein
MIFAAAVAILAFSAANAYNAEIEMAKLKPHHTYSVHQICEKAHQEAYKGNSVNQWDTEILEPSYYPFKNTYKNKQEWHQIRQCCNKNSHYAKKSCLKAVRENVLDKYCEESLHHTCCKNEFETRYTCFSRNPFTLIQSTPSRYYQSSERLGRPMERLSIDEDIAEYQREIFGDRPAYFAEVGEEIEFETRKQQLENERIERFDEEELELLESGRFEQRRNFDQVEKAERQAEIALTLARHAERLALRADSRHAKRWALKAARDAHQAARLASEAARSDDLTLAREATRLARKAVREVERTVQRVERTRQVRGGDSIFHQIRETTPYTYVEEVEEQMTAQQEAMTGENMPYEQETRRFTAQDEAESLAVTLADQNTNLPYEKMATIQEAREILEETEQGQLGSRLPWTPNFEVEDVLEKMVEIEGLETETERPCPESTRCLRKVKYATDAVAQKVCNDKIFNNGKLQTRSCCRAGAIVGKTVGRKNTQVCAHALHKFVVKTHGCVYDKPACKGAFVECCQQRVQTARQENAFLVKDLAREGGIFEESDVYERRPLY